MDIVKSQADTFGEEVSGGAVIVASRAKRGRDNNTVTNQFVFWDLFVTGVSCNTKP